MTEPSVFCGIACQLGEGPLWVPEADALIWADIENGKLLMQGLEGEARVFSMPEKVSALARYDGRFMLASTETGLARWEIGSNRLTKILDVEADNAMTRANDGRTDRHGAFWISSMGHNAEADMGALYRYAKGQLETIAKPITIPNATCFSPDGKWAYFCDTPTNKIIRWPLDPNTGHPDGPAELFVDISDTGFGADGAVIDAEGALWNAQWGGSRVVRYLPDGTVDRIIELPTSQATCPAFGGPDNKTLFVTTAYSGMSEEQRAKEPLAGCTFKISVDVEGILDPVYAGELHTNEMEYND